ncbi:MAG: BrnT family toxin [Bdellovibrio sp.]|nr:BrnT family toxin [Bdellovibrio sp.]
MKIEFVWDLRKAASNKKKHGVSFDEASGVFYDESALLIRDVLHSLGEERFILLGRGSLARVLVVVHIYWESAETIRIVSARLASRGEVNQYYRR